MAPPPPGGRSRKRRFPRWLLVVLLLFAAGAGVGIARLYRRLDALVNFAYTGKGWKFPTRLYSDWFVLSAEHAPSRDLVVEELEARGFRPSGAAVPGPGEYHASRNALAVRLARFDYPDGWFEGGLFRIRWTGGGRAAIEELSGDDSVPARGKRPPAPRVKRAVASIRLEPVLLGEIFDPSREKRSFVPLSEIPEHLRSAVIASEDRRFARHWGVDFRSISRALLRNVQGRTIVEGGSTLDQQIVKNLFLSRERTFTRKASEVVLAFLLDRRYSKDRILEIYLNQIYLGQSGSTSIAGVEEGARHYFGKSVRDLDLAESVLLVSIIPAPNLYSPVTRPAASRKRREVVLARMVEAGALSPGAADSIATLPIRVAKSRLPAARAPYFVDYLRLELGKEFEEGVLGTRGLRVISTLDPRLQRIAEREVSRGLREVRGRIAWLNPDTLGVEAALVAVDPRNGAVRAMVGGSSYAKTQFNRATDAERQPGSAFKPIVYAAAMDTWGRRDSVLTPATVLEDVPRAFESEEGPWKPRNNENLYLGRASVARALAKSQNVASVNLLLRVGIPRAVEFARLVGITSPLRAVPSLVLGTNEVTPLELTGAFLPFADRGRKPPLHGVRTVMTQDRRILYGAPDRAPLVLRPETAAVVTELLRGVVVYGTGWEARTLYGVTRPAAGKTGTTDEEKDAWFIGYTPSLLATVWMGCDGSERLGLTGTQAAVPVWGRFVADALRFTPAEEFEYPPGVVHSFICPESGGIGGPWCPRVMRALFVSGTEPKNFCASHTEEWNEDGPDGWGEEESTADTTGENGTRMR
jgi:penicillin-binding protein 1B